MQEIFWHVLLLVCLLLFMCLQSFLLILGFCLFKYLSEIRISFLSLPRVVEEAAGMSVFGRREGGWVL